MRVSEPEVSELERQAQARAARGSLLFHLALAEALAGDALAGRFSPEAVSGWALDVTRDGYEVTAVGHGAPAGVLARVTFAADGSALVEAGGDQAATLRQVVLAQARETVAAYGAGLGGRWLALPVPPPLDAPLGRAIEAYLVRLGDRPTDLAAGPHWRLTVAADSPAVLAAEPACRIFPEAAREGLTVLVHEEDATPSEVHVMLSLQLGVGLEVRTPRSGLRWRVDGETVSASALPLS